MSMRKKQDEDFLDRLEKMARENEGATKLDAGKGFMPLHVELIGEWGGKQMMSLAHYGRQNGDAMRDPDVVFVKMATGWTPTSIQQDYLGKYEETIELAPDGERWAEHAAKQYDLINFCAMWFKNIQAQQNL